MPETLSTNIFDKIDLLIINTTNIINHIEKQKTMLGIRTGIVETILLVVTVIALAFIFFFINKKIKTAKDDEHIRDKYNNYRCVALCVLFASFIFFLFEFGLSQQPKGFICSQADLLFTIALIFTIVGAIWSVFSRIESTRAFKQSKKTFEALGSTFDFLSLILDEDKLQKVYASIGESNADVSLYIGFPIVGLPYLKNKKHKTNSSYLCKVLNEKLHKIKGDADESKSINGTLNIGYINAKESKMLLDDIILKNLLNEIVAVEPTAKTILSTISKHTNFDDYTNLLSDIENAKKEISKVTGMRYIPDGFQNKIEEYELLIKKLYEFYTYVDFFYPLDHTTSSRKNKYVGVNFLELELKEKFRFVTIKETVLNEKQIRYKTYVWVVDLKDRSKGIFESLESRVFQTEENKFFTLLENIFTN